MTTTMTARAIGPHGQPLSTRTRLAVTLLERALAGKNRGWVYATPRDLAKLVDSDEHTVVHLLFSLRKSGLVEFGVSKTNRTASRRGTSASYGTPSNGIPVRIRVTRFAMEDADNVVARIKAENALDEDVRDIAAQIASEARKPAQDAGQPDEAITSQPDSADAPGAVSDAQDESSGDDPEDDAPETTDDLWNEGYRAGIATTYPGVALDRFPVIAALAASQANHDQIIEAAILLREAGQTDLAEMAEAAVVELTPVESEALQLVHDLRGRGLLIE